VLEDGYIKLYRSMLKWEWYDDINTKVVFLHLLLTVNHYDEQWHGIEIRRGSRVSSYGKLAKETRLSVQNVRTSIKRLISTGELTHSATAEYGLFTIVNYEKYQCPTHDLTESQQSANSQPTHNQQQSKKARKQESNNKEIISPIVSLEIEPEIAEAWDAYLEMRKGCKPPMTERAKKMALDKLNEFAPNDYKKQIKILNQSVLNSWKGLYQLKGDDYNGRSNRASAGTVPQTGTAKYGNVYE
jgi:hypothetical protein